MDPLAIYLIQKEKNYWTITGKKRKAQREQKGKLG